MCCDGSEEEHLPPVVQKMVERYRELHAQRSQDWGGEHEAGARVLYQFASWCDIDLLAEDLFKEVDAPGTLTDPVDAVLRALADPLPPGLAIVRENRVELPEPLPLAITGQPVTYRVLIAGNGQPGSATQALVSAEDPYLEVAGRRVRAVDPAYSGRLRLVSDAVSRWTVLDGRGGGWIPAGALPKYDTQNLPFFHGDHVVMDVPAGPLTVSVTRGCEFRPASQSVRISPGEEVLVELSPERLYDAAARGWYGGDLHVHMNWTGDQVCTPRDAALMQRGEGLHLMNLLAANGFTSLIYDREAFEHYVGQVLPWSDKTTVAGWGVEYRNDLMGHFTALNPAGPPTRYQTGHVRSHEPQDWPPNAVAAAEFRDLGATIGYTHPIQAAIENGDPAEIFALYRSRSTEARELVADAALGLVDSVDLGGMCHVAATEYVYHRLLGSGLRLAVTAGTDAILSHSHSSPRSNPPGWCRAYANLDGAPLSVPAWQDAVRARRTFTTNGPWLQLAVDGHGIGDTLDIASPRPVHVTARVIGTGVDTLEIVGPEGPLAAFELTDGQEEVELSTHIDVREPTWLVAIARGGDQLAGFGAMDRAYAHTSPVWIDIANRSVARVEDARWCLDWLDRFEALVRAKGNFTAPGQLEDLLAVLDKARGVYRAIAS